MVRPGKKRAPPPPARGGRPRAPPLGEDDYDEVEKFHRQKRGFDDDELESTPSGSDGEGEEVFDVASGSDASDSEQDDERLRELTRQARAMESKVRAAKGEDEGEESDEGDEGTTRWGRKSAYYDADVGDLEASDDEEALKDEEAEARLLQREAASRLEEEDFGAISEGEDEDEGSGGAGAGPTAAAAASPGWAPEDVSDMTEAERLEAVERSAPELLSLLRELEDAMREVRGRVGPVLREVRSGGLATAEGLSFLDAKQLLLTHYAACLTFFLLLKAEGRKVAGHPVVERLVTLRTYLERARPIDKKLEYQVSKLLAAAAAASGGDAEALLDAEEDDALRAAPRPGALAFAEGPEAAGGAGAGDALGMENGDASDGGPPAADGVYRPPKRRAAAMEEDPDSKGARAAERAARRERKRAERSGLLEDLARELSGAPEEERGGGQAAEGRESRRDELWARERAEIEEDLMVRVPLSREERKRAKQQRRAGLSGTALLDDLADDLGGILDGGSSGPAAALGAFARHTASQRFGGEAPARGGAARSGDSDLPAREPLAARRARVDDARARRTAADEAAGRAAAPEPRERVEDDFYRAAKARKAEADARRTAAPSPWPATHPPLEQARAPGARPIGRDIEANRGLGARRGKTHADPRVKHRVKYDKAQVRRRGQVQDVRAPSEAYGGEATGIKSRVSKSVKF